MLKKLKEFIKRILKDINPFYYEEKAKQFEKSVEQLTELIDQQNVLFQKAMEDLIHRLEDGREAIQKIDNKLDTNYNSYIYKNGTIKTDIVDTDNSNSDEAVENIDNTTTVAEIQETKEQ